MNDPIKVIHKYKNNNRRIQYHIYIFIGDIVDDKCMKILNIIKSMDLYTSLISLESFDREILETNYGEYWYEKFFNSYHIINTKKNIFDNNKKKEKLKEIYGDKWLSDHILLFKNKLETVTYTYEYAVKKIQEKKSVKETIARQRSNIQEILDYTFGTYTESNAQSRIQQQNEEIYDDDKDISGDSIHYVEDSNSENSLSDITVDYISSSNEKSQDELTSEEYYSGVNNTIKQKAGDDFEVNDLETDDIIDIDDQQNVDFDNEIDLDLESADYIYNEIDNIDKNITKLSTDIKKIISEDEYDKSFKKIIDFDTSNNDSMFDENLKDIYKKTYVTHQFIYKDDTIKTINNKICCSFKNNPIFGENAYILPAYQYLWTEYYYKDKKEKLMLGQKWVIKNDIIRLDIEPKTNLNVYEELRGPLEMLRNNIKRHGKIKRIDDDYNILYDYENYCMYNEIYMIDIYNELGIGYEPSFEGLTNLIDVYIKIYFPKNSIDNIKNILDLLNNSEKTTKNVLEKNKMELYYNNINYDLILENEIMHIVEITKKKYNEEIEKLFEKNYVIHSTVRVYLTENFERINLFYIFDNFVLDENYPFIQYNPIGGIPRTKYNEKIIQTSEKKDIIIKWFEKSSYGINFKKKINDKIGYKYISINLTDTGRLDYKIQWKEEDMYTIEDIKETYKYVYDLIKKINEENKKNGISFEIPNENNFTYAFINTIQKFELPNNYIINHNDLSEFSRLFFPYVSLVVQPRKRIGKKKQFDVNEKSKYGTYLRYKRISKYDNKSKIEKRIIFFIRNYEYNDKSLAREISNEFNITDEQALIEIISVREKYPKIKKSRKILKKLENIPKYKLPGIGIDIQGKSKNNYKIKVAGARNNNQLNRIILFMNILIYLYLETYLIKKPEYQIIKNKLKNLTKIAKRRNKVEEIVEHAVEIKNVKQIISIDKSRLGYKAEDDRNQWTKQCQQSGDNKRRQPQIFVSIDELLQQGYEWREKTDEIPVGHFAKKIPIPGSKNKKKKEIILRAVKLPLDEAKDTYVYYTCDPKMNGKHIYIGFLGKSINPENEELPCCFIKDQLFSKNKSRREYFLKSIGITPKNKIEKKHSDFVKDQLYILQDSNKIQEGRLSELPKYLDIFMNFMIGNEKIINKHNLISTNQYYFKYGVVKGNDPYLSAISTLFNLSIDTIKQNMINILRNDKKLKYFTSLNGGDIRLRFNTIEDYINYIENNIILEYNYITDLLCLPGTIQAKGINILILQKKTKIIKKYLEKEKKKVNYYILCQNSENMSNIQDPDRKTIILIKENKFFFPIVLVKKKNENNKHIDIIKFFNYNNNPDNIVSHISKYYKVDCKSDFNILISSKSYGIFTAKKTYKILEKINKKEYLPKFQAIDERFKCTFIITNNNYIIPTIPSGTLYNINITENIKKYIKNYDETFQYLTELSKITRIKLKPVGIYYHNKIGKKYFVSAIMTESYDNIPIIDIEMSSNFIKKNGLHVQKNSNDDIINHEITQKNQEPIVDDRIYYTSKYKYETELYQLFRYHLSYYLNYVPLGIIYKDKIKYIINNNTLNKDQRDIKLKKILYTMTDITLAKTFNELIKKIKLPTKTVKNKISKRNNQIRTVDSELDLSPAPKIINNMDKLNINFPHDEKKWLKIMPDNKSFIYPYFVPKNKRELCYINNNQEACNNNKYCCWNNAKNMCLLQINKKLLIKCINRVASEFLQNELKAHEILQEDKYFVADIINYNVYTERPEEKIVTENNYNIKKILAEIFGEKMYTQLEKKRQIVISKDNYDKLSLDYPLKYVGEWYVQYIIDNNNTLFRTFANVYYWLLHPYNDVSTRNLNYYSPIQSKLAIIYKSQVIDWLRIPENMKTVESYIIDNTVENYILKISEKISTNTDCIIELIVLSIINKIVIHVYDSSYKLIYTFHPIHGFTDLRKSKKIPNNKYKKIVNLKFHIGTDGNIPEKIFALYPKL